MKCLICKKQYQHLGSHLKKHKITARDYKMEFGLDLNYPLMSDEIIEKKRKAFWEHPNCKIFLKNLKKGGEKYRFKKGEVNRDYFSRQSLDRFMNNLHEINSKKPINCLICNLKTKHLGSHLFNAHGLLIIDKNKLLKNELNK